MLMQKSVDKVKLKIKYCRRKAYFALIWESKALMQENIENVKY